MTGKVSGTIAYTPLMRENLSPPNLGIPPKVEDY